MGSPAVVGVDIDEDALEIALENCEQFEDLPVGGAQLPGLQEGRGRTAVGGRASTTTEHGFVGTSNRCRRGAYSPALAWWP